MAKIKQDRLFVKDYLFIASIWFCAFAGLLSDSINKLALYGVVPTLFVITFLSSRRIITNKYMNLLSALFLWILFSVLWATNIELALVQVHQILGAFILCYIFCVKGQNEKYLPGLYLSFIVLLIGDWYYAYNNMFDVMNLGVDRLNDHKLNANTFGYHTFYATFSVFILGEWDWKIKKVLRALFLLMIPLSFITAIYTASRQILLIQTPLILLLLYGRYYKSSRLIMKLVTLIILVVTIVIFAPKVNQLYDGSTLQKRNEVEVKDDVRVKLMADAFKVGNNHFPLGVGANNYMIYSFDQHFSHNTYLELYANEGVIGVLLYVAMLGVFLKRQLTRYLKTKDLMFFYFLVAGVTFAVDGFFYVFYPYLWLISFFILIATHGETYYKKYTR